MAKSNLTNNLPKNLFILKIYNKIKSHWKKIILLIVGFNLLLTSWYVVNNDLFFHADIARDFLLLNEVENKKIVLIGPRAGADGFYHGPLWMYLNFPIYSLFNGNPIATGWFWVFLIFFTLVSGFAIFKHIFNLKTAYLYMLLLSSYLIYLGRTFSHPQMNIVLMPFFFYTFWKYINTFKLRFLIANVILNGMLIQLEIAIGAPFLVLTFFYILFSQFKAKKLHHIMAYFFILIPLSTYIFFDLRHNFLMTTNLITYLKGNKIEYYVGFVNVFKNRIEYILTYAMPVINEMNLTNKILNIIFLGTIIYFIKIKSHFAKIYQIFLYLFFGFFLISLTSRYYLYDHHFAAFIPIVIAMVASIFVSKFAKYFILILFLIIIQNQIQAIKYIYSYKNFSNINESSWKFYNELENKVFAFGLEKEFGYFIYTPDKLSYSPKYAMIYGQKTHPDKKAYAFEKKPITYVIIAPPPKSDPFMLGDWWRINSINIKKEPIKIISFPNGYKIERYELTEEEIKIPFDPSIDTGIHFR